jgi:hypothetical protein
MCLLGCNIRRTPKVRPEAVVVVLQQVVEKVGDIDGGLVCDDGLLLPPARVLHLRHPADQEDSQVAQESWQDNHNNNKANPSRH